jgi:hypothetical protein
MRAISAELVRISPERPDEKGWDSNKEETTQGSRVERISLSISGVRMRAIIPVPFHDVALGKA